MKSVDDRFWSKVPIRGDGCWLWGGAIQKQWGYGLFRLNGKCCLAHRVAYELHNRRGIPDGMLVRHRCDTPACVRPDHLLLGTNLDNARDCVERGRKRVGTAHQFAKLSESDVTSIRSVRLPLGRHVSREYTRAMLAAKYGVSISVIDKVRLRKIWRHVP